MEHGLESHQLVGRHQRVDRRVLKSDTDNAAYRPRVSHHVEAAYPSRPPGGSEQGGEHPHDR